MIPLNPYEAFVQLSQIDQRILGLQKILDSYNLQNEELLSALNSNKKSLQEKHAILAETQKQQTSLEIELKTSLSSIMKKQKQLESSGSSREYQTLSQEINDLEKKKAELEDKILVLWQQLEELQEAYKAQAITAEEKSVLIAQGQHLINAKIEEAKSQIVDLIHETVNLQGSLNPLVLTNYLKMKERVPNPGVEVIDGRCTGCYYPVPSQDLSDLRKHKILACKDCYRLLFMR